MLLEVEDDPDVGAAPAVDRLVIIAHNAQVVVLARDQLDEPELRLVDVLVLIHEHVAEALLILTPDLLMLIEELHGLHDEVVEVQRVIPLKLLLVAGVDPPHQHLPLALRGAQVVVHRHELILRVADRPEHLVVGAIGAAIAIRQAHVQPGAHFLHDGRLVALAEDRVLRHHAHVLAIHAEDPCADGVEGPRPDPLRALLTDEPVDALAHLIRGLVREGDGEDGLRIDPAVLNHVSDAEGERTRLPGARSREDQDGPFDALRGRTLFRVEFFKQ